MAKDKKGSKKRATGKVLYRDAQTGQFVTKTFASKHPKTTVTETFKGVRREKFSDSRDDGGSRTGGPKRR